MGKTKYCYWRRGGRKRIYTWQSNSHGGQFNLHHDKKKTPYPGCLIRWSLFYRFL